MNTEREILGFLRSKLPYMREWDYKTHLHEIGWYKHFAVVGVLWDSGRIKAAFLGRRVKKPDDAENQYLTFNDAGDILVIDQLAADKDTFIRLVESAAGYLPWIKKVSFQKVKTGDEWHCYNFDKFRKKLIKV